MRSICLYFQVHQPFRLRTYRFFDMGVNHHYYDEFQNKSIVQRIAQKCYLPSNEAIFELIKKHGKSFNVAYSISGLAIEQFEKYAPEVIESFKNLAASGNVEFLTETYAHSLISLKSKDEFKRQVELHSKKIEELFGQKPVTFRNTELIYSDEIGEMVADMGYKTMLTEGAKHVLGWKSPNFVYRHAYKSDLKLLLKNYRLSDDIAFRFSDQGWGEWPLTADKYTSWLKDIDKDQQLVNLFMDYETFGEHQWAETGIFDFLKALPEKVLSETDFTFEKPKDVSKKLNAVDEVHVPNPISWADEERDLTAWLGNEMQDEAFDKLCSVEDKIRSCNDEDILNDWNYLQASDHFYYMCTKWFSDGDVHRYFNPYPSPYEAFINYMNVLSDFIARVEDKCSPVNFEDLKDKAKEFIDETVEKGKKTKDDAKTRAKEKWDDVKEYSLDDIAKMSNAKVKELIKKVDIEELTKVMKDAKDEVKDKIIPNMTKTVKTQYEKFEKEIEKVKKSDLKKVKNKIEEELRRLWK
ncbi:MAG: alpha-amylase [Bacteroidetes bacterium 4484_249]|nr:MAG: alpha-amylase [Bacteroidetes bacterium 4484_249]